MTLFATMSVPPIGAASRTEATSIAINLRLIFV